MRIEAIRCSQKVEGLHIAAGFIHHAGEGSRLLVTRSHLWAGWRTTGEFHGGRREELYPPRERLSRFANALTLLLASRQDAPSTGAGSLISALKS
jgi:hypothetical protein